MARVQDLTFERLQDLYSNSNSSNNKNNQDKSNKSSGGTDMAHAYELFAIKSATGTPRAESDNEEIESTGNTGVTKTMQPTKVNPSEFAD